MDRALLERMVGAAALVLLLVIFAPALLDGTGEPGPDGLNKGPEDREVRTQVIVLNEPRVATSDESPAADVDAGPPKIIVPERPAPVAADSSGNRPSASGPVTPAEPATKAAEAAPAPAKVPAPSPVTPPPPAAKPPSATPATVAAPGAGQQAVAAKKPPEALPKPSTEKATKPPAGDSKASSAAGGFAVQLGSFSQAENAQKYAAQLTDRGFAVFVRSSGSASAAIHRVYAGPRPDRQAAEKLAAVLGNAGYKGIVVDLSGSVAR